jgi:hypothetical protein
VRSITELELGRAYGPTRLVRLIAATLDPATLDPESTWFLATTLPRAEANPEQVSACYRVRDWTAHYDQPAKHALGWADYQMRSEQAMVRHWQLVMLAYTFRVLVGVPTAPPETAPDAAGAGGNIGARRRRHQAGRLERHAAARPRLVVPMGPPSALLAAVVDRTPSQRTGGAPRPRRSLLAARPPPDLTNQR